MKNSILILAFGLLLGYLLGAMFNGFNTLKWSELSQFAYVVWFIMLIVRADINYEQTQYKKNKPK